MADVPRNKNFVALAENHMAGADMKPIVCLEGSSRSGKTWGILEYLVTFCEASPGLVVTCFREDGTTHAGAAMRDFLLIMPAKFPDLWQSGSWNSQEKKFKFANGSLFEFWQTNDVSKLHGPQRDVAWFNEAMEISYEAYAQISRRTSTLQIFDWNPSFNHHWVFDKVLKRPDVLYVHSTYKDNPHLTAQQVSEIEKFDPGVPANVQAGTADKWQWEVYGLGKRGRREGTIFQMWQVEDRWPDAHLFQRHGYGIDFGFSQDPSAVIECGVFQGDLWLREIVYEKGLCAASSASMPGQPSIESRMKDAGVSPTKRFWCDGARPDLIRELQMAGFNAAAGEKGAGSVMAGINLLRGIRIHVMRGSQNIQRELEQYAWKKNRATGELLGEPEDANNHAMDAIRYWAWKEIRSAQSGDRIQQSQQAFVAATCITRY